MDVLFLNQKTNKNIRISYSLKYKHSKKIIYGKVNDSVCDMVKHELRVASYELRVKSFKTRVENQKCEFKSTSYEFKSTSYKFKSTSYEFKFTNHFKSVQTQVNSLKSSSFLKIISPKLFGNL